MGGRKSITVLFVLMVIHYQVCNAKVHKVGDDAGWTVIGPPDYKAWAASKSFRVGDQLLFQYNRTFHSVVQVTHKHFEACNVSRPNRILTTGKDTLRITEAGHYFFVCGKADHCKDGQKVAITVPKAHGRAPTPTPSPTINTFEEFY